MNDTVKTTGAPGAKDDKPAVPDDFAVLLKFHGDAQPGRIVRGPPPAIAALIAKGVARKATAADKGIAGGRFVTLK